MVERSSHTEHTGATDWEQTLSNTERSYVDRLRRAHFGDEVFLGNWEVFDQMRSGEIGISQTDITAEREAKMKIEAEDRINLKLARDMIRGNTIGYAWTVGAVAPLPFLQGSITAENIFWDPDGITIFRKRPG